MRPFVKRSLMKRAWQLSQNVQGSAEPNQPSIWLRLRAARTAQVSFVEFEVPNKP